MKQTRSFQLTAKTIDCQSLKAAIADDRAGAVVDFEGRVRNHNAGQSVASLAYEACDSLAEAEAARIFAEAKQRFSFYHAVCAHRTGLLQVGDVAVYVAVSSAHRGDAFAACRFIIDEIKYRLPIWKKESYIDGSCAWVNCQHQHDAPAPQSELKSERELKSECASELKPEHSRALPAMTP
jgi:molybdopterin synthase catalytic subunit